MTNDRRGPASRATDALQGFRFADEKTAALPPGQLKAARIIKELLSRLETPN